MLSYLVAVGVNEISGELYVLTLHEPSWAWPESLHGAALCTLLQVIWSWKLTSQRQENFTKL